MFKRIFNKTASSFDEVKAMLTRKLPLPGLGDGDKFIQIRAERRKSGYWALTFKHNLRTVTAHSEETMRCFQRALKKHTGKHHDIFDRFGDPAECVVNFDSAFLVLREMEETMQKLSPTLPPAEEPAHHYMTAYRLMPQTFRENIDYLYFARMQDGKPVWQLDQPQPPRRKPEDPAPPN